ncbi:ATP-dependent endonuclease [Ammoniphilus sp. CFH 90114]|uniref:ATP-dependent nuclease n=1 Tax=Ammoniphilus sp. CFH 90114 TaxID=2493665 RepID=UPI00100E4B94|nr:AAA family ATPase [Ammoniphilus sp. CFH 90114]RXT05269.1 hypothetical protein EIZ39_17990 [Ammoniphilus sp. CFH 90114]
MPLRDIERRLLERWESMQYQKTTLRKLKINGLRGLDDFSLDINYPVFAIAGENGTGKSTILGCIACAYHSVKGFTPFDKGNNFPYYTFGDFFITSRFDTPYNNAEVIWNYSGANYPESYTARKGKKWSKYEKRPKRAVQFIGISRALPAIEQRVLKAHFVGKGKNTHMVYSQEVKQIASAILGRTYTSAERYGSNDIHSLNVVNAGDVYSGFNMGAGEDVVLTLINMLHEVPDDTLVIIEEIETGLHPKAQKEILKHIIDISFKKHLQVIMTTHSQVVLDSLPPEGRVVLRRNGTKVTPEYRISSSYAFSILIQESIPELTIYTEDDVAQNLVLAALPLRIRKRVRVIYVGSWMTVTSQTAAFFRDNNLGKNLAIYDGDCNMSEVNKEYKKHFGVQTLDQTHINWLANHTFKLPGNEPPEKWLMNMNRNDEFCINFAISTNCEKEEVADILRSPYFGDHHDYFHYLSGKLGLPAEQVKIKFIQVAVKVNMTLFQDLVSKIETILDETLVIS